MTAAPIEAYERWAYGVGWTAGPAEGHRLGFDEGYPAGFDAGADVGGARMLLAVEAALGGRLPDLLPDLPHAAGYQDYRRRTAPTDKSCGTGCGRCSQCVRAAAVADSSARVRPARFSGRCPVSRPALVALIGPTGAGKSTYAHAVYGGRLTVSLDDIRELLGGDPAEVSERRPPARPAGTAAPPPAALRATLRRAPPATGTSTAPLPRPSLRLVKVIWPHLSS